MAGTPAVSTTPHRTPEAVADGLADVLRGRTVCEIGSAHGDHLVFMLKYAKEAVGVELPGRHSDVARARGLTIVEKDVRLLEELPRADVYYWWISLVMDEYLVERLLGDPDFHGTLLIGKGGSPLYGDSPLNRYVPDPETCMRWIEYDEGSGPRESGWFSVLVLEADEARARAASFTAADPEAPGASPGAGTAAAPATESGAAGAPAPREEPA